MVAKGPNIFSKFFNGAGSRTKKFLGGGEIDLSFELLELKESGHWIVDITSEL